MYAVADAVVGKLFPERFETFDAAEEHRRELNIADDCDVVVSVGNGYCEPADLHPCS